MPWQVLRLAKEEIPAASAGASFPIGRQGLERSGGIQKESGPGPWTGSRQKPEEGICASQSPALLWIGCTVLISLIVLHKCFEIHI